MSFRIKVDAKRRAGLRLVADAYNGLFEAWLKAQTAGATKVSVGEKIGWHKSAVTRALQQPKNMTLMTLGELAHALDVPVRIAFGEEQPKPGSNLTVQTGAASVVSGVSLAKHAAGALQTHFEARV